MKTYKYEEYECLFEDAFKAEQKAQGWISTGEFRIVDFYDVGTMANPHNKIPKTVKEKFVKIND